MRSRGGRYATTRNTCHTHLPPTSISFRIQLARFTLAVAKGTQRTSPGPGPEPHPAQRLIVYSGSVFFSDSKREPHPWSGSPKTPERFAMDASERANATEKSRNRHTPLRKHRRTARIIKTLSSDRTTSRRVTIREPGPQYSVGRASPGTVARV